MAPAGLDALGQAGARRRWLAAARRHDLGTPGAGIFAVIEKPFEFASVVRVVAAAVAHGRSGRG